MEKTNIKTTTYSLNEWRFDIVELEDTWEVWLYRTDIGIKTMMFGCDKVDNHGTEITLEDMAENADIIKQDYMKNYLSDYCDVDIVWEN